MTQDHPLSLLQNQLEREIEDQAILGAVAAVSAPHIGQFTLAAGFEDAAKTRSINTDARFLVYSITKTFIGVVTLRLVQQKVLALDDRLSSWFSEINFASAITVRQLLNHTAGLPDYGSLPSYQKAVKRISSVPWSFSEFLKHTCGHGLAFLPG
ncbi:MAG: beta-lactamase family protein, partial [Nitrososphaera sp.]|nr:beta-lactamase family protein [Nitrososphaera sp.]